MLWLERWKATHPESPLKPDYVTQQLSRCLNNKLSGVRFFFAQEHHERGELLLEVLGVEASKRQQIRDVAGQISGDSLVAPAILIDFTPWTSPAESAVVFEAVRKMLENARALGPTVLVLTADQKARIPFGLATLDGVRCEVALPDAWEQILELAGEGTLVVSNRVYDNVEFWLALDLTNGNVAVHPVVGLEHFAKHRRLPARLEVLHPLSALDIQSEPINLPKSAVARRKLIFDLADTEWAATAEDEHGYTIEDRAGLAQALGVEATSTLQERRDHELRGLVEEVERSLGQGSVTKGERNELERERLRRATRSLPAAALLIDERIHVLRQPGDSQPIPESPRIEIHEVAPRVVLQEYLDVLRGWSEEDYFADPYLDQLRTALRPPPELDLLYRHAQAFLLLTGACPKPVEGEPADWRLALGTILKDGPAAAEIMLPTRWRDSYNQQCWMQFGERSQFGGNEEWPCFPPVWTRAAVGRGVQFRALAVEYGTLRPEFSHQPILLSLRSGVDPVATWRGLADASTTLTHYTDDSLLKQERRTWKGASYFGPPSEPTNDSILLVNRIAGSPSEVTKPDWEALDAQAMALWLGLQIALRDPIWTPMHDGTTGLFLGGGITARIRARIRAGGHERGARVYFAGELEERTDQYGRLLPHRALVCTLAHYTHSALTNGVFTQFGTSLPTAIVLCSGGFEVTIAFSTSALLGSGPILGGVGASVAAHLEREAEEERARRAAMDDDD